MTLRLADIDARIDGVEQLGAVVNAMRGIAAARAQQARTQVKAVDSYAATIAAAIGRALTLMPSIPHKDRAADTHPALVVFAAEQGFAGAFSEHVFASLGDDLAGSPIFLIGTRGATVLAERGIDPAWLGAMPSHSAGIPKLADQVAEALYSGLAKGEIVALDVVFSQRDPGHDARIERITLLPLDLSRFPASALGPPLHNLAPAELLAGLTADYFHAQLCHAALHAFAAENEARMEAMAAARDQSTRQLVDLQAQARLVRQEEITAEVIELAAGAAASQARAR
ncbi:F0F1 ATP synthase subunit gamma [Sphingomonas sp. PAMC 26621]|uniref:F0F1 ATP synthase subunit gamma n=1 Tax=Sphingomonas sp. PAMC 26621 TaxID=1112213 RepID=UPI000289D279|nr:FoF1 ATP synthase subunit gamma [Sphingomonas sp. PAMC 26621]